MPSQGLPSTVFGPVQDLFEVTDRAWDAEWIPGDDHLSPHGRVMEILSEHTCQGWLEGYLLTGRHGFFSCYEAFIHIVDSMFNQHAKWLKTAAKCRGARPIASLNYLLTSHVWRQDHNGFSHQDPGFIDHVVNKKADDRPGLFSAGCQHAALVADHCLRSRNRINVIVAGKQPQPQWLDMDAASSIARRFGIWEWASNDDGGRRRRDGLRRRRADARDAGRRRSVCASIPELKVRVVNVVDLITLQPDATSARLGTRDFDAMFTKDKPGDLRLSRLSRADPRLTYRRTNHDNFHVADMRKKARRRRRSTWWCATARPLPPRRRCDRRFPTPGATPLMQNRLSATS